MTNLCRCAFRRISCARSMIGAASSRICRRAPKQSAACSPSACGRVRLATRLPDDTFKSSARQPLRSRPSRLTGLCRRLSVLRQRAGAHDAGQRHGRIDDRSFDRPGAGRILQCPDVARERRRAALPCRSGAEQRRRGAHRLHVFLCPARPREDAVPRLPRCQYGPGLWPLFQLGRRVTAMNREQEIAALQQRVDADAAGVVRMNPKWRAETERRLAALRAPLGRRPIKRSQWLALLSLFYGLAAMMLLGLLDPQPLGFWPRLIASLLLASLVYGSLLKRTARRMAQKEIIDRG